MNISSPQALGVALAPGEYSIALPVGTLAVTATVAGLEDGIDEAI